MKVIDAKDRFTTSEDRIAEAIIKSGDLISRAIRAQQAIEEHEADMRRLIENSAWLQRKLENGAA